MSKVHFRGTVELEGMDHRQDVKADIPAGVNLQIGVDVDNRGKIRIGHTVDQKGADGYMNALGTGGAFTAYVDEFLVGRGNADTLNSFDMSLMDSCNVDASPADVEIGTGGTGDGMVGLPSGTATFGSLTVGQASDGAGLLRLAGTDLTVLGDLVIGATGSVDLISGSGLGNITVLAGGSLTINGDVLGAGTYSSIDYPDHITGSGTITLVPEPGTLALLGLGGLGALLRRRK